MKNSFLFGEVGYPSEQEESASVYGTFYGLLHRQKRKVYGYLLKQIFLSMFIPHNFFLEV